MRSRSRSAFLLIGSEELRLRCIAEEQMQRYKAEAERLLHEVIDRNHNVNIKNLRNKAEAERILSCMRYLGPSQAPVLSCFLACMDIAAVGR